MRPTFDALLLTSANAVRHGGIQLSALSQPARLLRRRGNRGGGAAGRARRLPGRARAMPADLAARLPEELAIFCT